MNSLKYYIVIGLALTFLFTIVVSYSLRVIKSNEHTISEIRESQLEIKKERDIQFKEIAKNQEEIKTICR